MVFLFLRWILLLLKMFGLIFLQLAHVFYRLARLLRVFSFRFFSSRFIWLSVESTGFWKNDIFNEHNIKSTGFWTNWLFSRLAFNKTHFSVNSLLKRLYFEQTLSEHIRLLNRRSFHQTDFWLDCFFTKPNFELTFFWVHFHRTWNYSEPTRFSVETLFIGRTIQRTTLLVDWLFRGLLSELTCSSKHCLDQLTKYWADLLFNWHTLEETPLFLSAGSFNRHIAF